MSAKSDLTFIAIDFEGRSGRHDGINECGISRIRASDMIAFSRRRELSIQADEISGTDTMSELIGNRNYRLIKHGVRRRCDFAETVRTTTDLLPGLILSDLGVLPPIPDGPKRFVLVGHSVSSDIHILSTLGINVYELPGFSGTLDTCVLAGKILGLRSNLRGLLAKLGIPYQRHIGKAPDEILRSAGNDAHLTLRALLAMIHRRSAGNKTRWLEELATLPLPPLNEKFAAPELELVDVLDGLEMLYLASEDFVPYNGDVPYIKGVRGAGRD
jgi:hypothetical protein